MQSAVQTEVARRHPKGRPNTQLPALSAMHLRLLPIIGRAPRKLRGAWEKMYSVEKRSIVIYPVEWRRKHDGLLSLVYF